MIFKSDIDLSDKVTVFLIHGNCNPNLTATRQAIFNQNCEFKYQEISNVSPMSLAFQQMLDKCTTKYYVQVDEDMVLNEDAILKLYNLIEHSANNVAFAFCKLHDVHLNFDLVGVKIYKHEIMKKYPYNLNSMSCEVSQINDMKRDNYTYLDHNEVIGLHSPLWTNGTIFERYFNLMEKEQEFKYIWMKNLPNMLWNILKDNPTKLNLMAFLGAYSSIIGSSKQVGEKTFDSYKKDELIKLSAYLTEE